MNIRILLPGAVAVCTMLSAGAQDYSSKPVRLIVPCAAGGNPDMLARLYGQRLGETLGQTFVVDNRPGAGGMTAKRW